MYTINILGDKKELMNIEERFLDGQYEFDFPKSTIDKENVRPSKKGEKRKQKSTGDVQKKEENRLYQ